MWHTECIFLLITVCLIILWDSSTLTHVVLFIFSIVMYCMTWLFIYQLISIFVYMLCLFNNFLHIFLEVELLTYKVKMLNFTRECKFFSKVSYSNTIQYSKVVYQFTYHQQCLSSHCFTSPNHVVWLEFKNLSLWWI